MSHFLLKIPNIDAELPLQVRDNISLLLVLLLLKSLELSFLNLLHFLFTNNHYLYIELPKKYYCLPILLMYKYTSSTQQRSDLISLLSLKLKNILFFSSSNPFLTYRHIFIYCYSTVIYRRTTLAFQIFDALSASIRII